MSSAFVPGLIVAPACRRVLLRELPIVGECLVNVGQSVNADQVVARAEIPGDLSVFRIAERLSIDASQVKKGLKVSIGQSVKTGDVLCTHMGLFGLFSSCFKAPHAGTVEFFSEQTGHLALRASSRLLEVNAHVNGLVSNVQQGKSVSIQTNCSFVQGIFGVGGERRGKLVVINSQESLLTKSGMLPADLKGAILVARGAPGSEFIMQVVKAGAVGLIVGSIDDKALHSYLGYDIGVAITGNENVPMTVIVTEGFGRLLMSGRVFNLLKSLEGKSVSINGATKVRAGAERPEIIVTAENSVEVSQTVNESALNLGLEVGAKVRVIRFPFFGLEGQVTDLPNAQKQIDTGVYTRVVEVKLADGKLVTVPRANVELLG